MLRPCAGKALCDDPARAHFGEAFDTAELFIVGLLGQAPDHRRVSAQLNRYERLIADVDGVAAGNRLVLSRRADQLWLIDTRGNPNDFPELTESSFARMVCASRRMPGEKQLVRAVHVTHTAPAYRAEYDRIFQMPVVFESDKNALLMTDDSWQTLKTPLPSRYVFGILSERAEALFKSLESSKSTRGRVESLLVPILHTGDASMDKIAGKLALSRQTMFRKLKAEGTTFQKVLDELRTRWRSTIWAERRSR